MPRQSVKPQSFTNCRILSLGQRWTRIHTDQNKPYLCASVSIRGPNFMVGPGGLEPPTSSLSGMRSSQLSYGPELPLWWSWSGSNRRPPECKSGALPAELQPLKILIEASWMQKPGVKPMALSEKLGNSKWRSGSGSPIPCGIDGLEWNGCSLLVHAVHSNVFGLSKTPPTFSLRKEVIQPQVLLRLPCYDFTPIMDHTLGRCPPCGSACRLLVQSTFVM